MNTVHKGIAANGTARKDNSWGGIPGRYYDPDKVGAVPTATLLGNRGGRPAGNGARRLFRKRNGSLLEYRSESRVMGSCLAPRGKK